MGNENKLKVYCETSFWSYLSGRPTPLQHIAIKQAATLQWWQEIAPSCDIFISQHVNMESNDGDPARKERMSLVMDNKFDYEDPIDEVYAIRRKIASQFGYSIRRIAEAAKEWRKRDEASGRKYVKLPTARVAPAMG